MDTLFAVQPHDLIVNITFAWEGAIAIVDKKDAGGLVSHRFPTFRFLEGKLECDFFRNIIIGKRFIFQLGVISPGGAGRNRVMNRKDFLRLKCIVPSCEEQRKIAQFLSFLDIKIDSVSAQVDAMQAFKQGLLQQMFV